MMSSAAADHDRDEPPRRGQNEDREQERDEEEHPLESVLRVCWSGYCAQARSGRSPRRRVLGAAPRVRERRHDGLVVDELEVDHLGGVALAGAEPDDARVAAGPLREARSDVGEEPVDDVFERSAASACRAGMEVAALAQRDHLLGERLDRLRLGLGRLDAAVLDQGAREIRVERLAMGGVPPELLAGSLVPHRARRAPRP